MKIVIIRHADPDYANDTLTLEGFKELEALSKYYNASMFDGIYSSTLRRALLTADAVVKGEKEIIACDWLVEFHHPIYLDDGTRHCNWDFMPSFLDKHQELIADKNTYLDTSYFQDIDLKGKYDKVIEEFDKVLESYGYKRYNSYYQVTKSNTKTLVFFCHFGLMTVLLSHLMNVPYTALAQSTCCLPTGVTTLVSEEREKGIAQFRMLKFGDVSHLEKEGIKPSFAGRFCEIYDSDDRH